MSLRKILVPFFVAASLCGAVKPFESVNVLCGRDFLSTLIGV